MRVFVVRPHQVVRAGGRKRQECTADTGAHHHHRCNECVIQVCSDLGWPFGASLSESCQFDTPESAVRIVVSRDSG